MKEPSVAYKLAECVHQRFFGPDSDLTSEEIEASGARIRVGVAEPYMTEVVTAMGYGGAFVYQNLSRSTKTGYFTLSTVFLDRPIEFSRITPNAPPEIVPTLEATLFMQALNAITEARES